MTTIAVNLRANSYYSGTKTLDGNSYLFTLRWNTHTEKWYMDMEGKTNDVDIKGVALLCGRDLLAPYGYVELGELRVIDNSDANEDPNYDDIGSRFSLEYTPIADL